MGKVQFTRENEINFKQMGENAKKKTIESFESSQIYYKTEETKKYSDNEVEWIIRKTHPYSSIIMHIFT